MAGPLMTYTRKLEPDEAAALERLLRSRAYEFRAVPHARFAAARPDHQVVFYESGKLVVQGKGTAEFVEFILEPEVLGRAERGYESILNPDLALPRIGVDESGKGDLFGPMCVAGVYANSSMFEAWERAGVRDSKSIGSDRKVGELAELIRSTPGCVTTVVPIGNEAYNRLHAKMKSVNRILAWGHARVIENLMNQRARLNPPPARVVLDQFAQSKAVIERALMASGREIEVVQRHKAESDVVVAAASILARNEFVTRLAKLGKECGVVLPKGAGDAANRALRDYVEKHGREKLGGVAKVHFRNILLINGLRLPDRPDSVGDALE